MTFQINTVKYSGKIKEVPLGAKKLIVGGNSSYAFHTFEGAHPHRPIIAMEVSDSNPGEDWNKTLASLFGGVLDDPGAWAKKCVEFGADAICLMLDSTDPNTTDAGAKEACAAVEKVLNAVDVPIFVYGVDNAEKDIITLSAIAEKFEGKSLILGPVTDGNYKQIGAQAMAYGHSVAARSPIDVNLAKQLNILLGGLGLPQERILIDPTCSGLGYGMEYTYSVMERLNMAALVQQDENLQNPIITPIGNEMWKTREANMVADDENCLGEIVARGVLLETTLSVSMLVAGASVVTVCHPESVKILKIYIDAMLNGGAVKADGLLPSCGCGK